VTGHHGDLVAMRSQAECLGMHDLADATQLREAVIRHYRHPHAVTIPVEPLVPLRKAVGGPVK
jgi:hypothetical protein